MLVFPTKKVLTFADVDFSHQKIIEIQLILAWIESNSQIDSLIVTNQLKSKASPACVVINLVITVRVHRRIAQRTASAVKLVFLGFFVFRLGSGA